MARVRRAIAASVRTSVINAQPALGRCRKGSNGAPNNRNRHRRRGGKGRCAARPLRRPRPLSASEDGQYRLTRSAATRSWDHVAAERWSPAACTNRPARRAGRCSSSTTMPGTADRVSCWSLPASAPGPMSASSAGTRRRGLCNFVAEAVPAPRSRRAPAGTGATAARCRVLADTRGPADHRRRRSNSAPALAATAQIDGTIPDASTSSTREPAARRRSSEPHQAVARVTHIAPADPDSTMSGVRGGASGDRRYPLVALGLSPGSAARASPPPPRSSGRPRTRPGGATMREPRRCRLRWNSRSRRAELFGTDSVSPRGGSLSPTASVARR